ncbi:MAG TPA: Glu-tRNA(Gln) amidotransferase subunit GatD [Candidatus Nanoarchaeia archaeon]|nr:Glu-tRNA(Gln) amidotransferase subunit GatD [Candidatus Nanoarchaeia archaeon]
MDYKPGDKVEIVTADSTVSGLVMPNSNKETLFLKLSSGYNVGIDVKKIKKVNITEPFKEMKKEAAQELKTDKKLPTILVLHTGGTIASSVDYRTGGVVSKFSPEELLMMIPELKEIANIKTNAIFQMFSEDMEVAHWSILAKTVEKQHKDIDGIIITHGTDTMAYTAAALSFALRDLPIPVILVGAQRSSDRPSSDAATNMIAASRFIANSDFAGVAVCMHKNEDDGISLIHAGTAVRKLHTSRRDAFRSINQKPIAEVDYKTGKVHTLRTDYLKKDKSRTLSANTDFEDKVVILKVHPGFNYKQLELYANYKGIILEGTGLGQAPTNKLDEETKDHPKLLEAIKTISKHTVVGMTSQCIYGEVNMNVYSTARDLTEAGVASCEGMTTETAYAKLCWLLGNNSASDAKKKLSENIVGEIPARIEKDTFLI